jgi:hypothetical protein
VTEFSIKDWQALCVDLRTEVMEWRRRALEYELRYLEERALRMQLEWQKNVKGQTGE